MKTSANNNLKESLCYFLLAKPVWKKDEERLLHSRVIFSCILEKRETATLYITGCNFYRIKLNDKFIGFGPARASHGYARVDIIPLKLEKEKNLLEIEALAYNTKSFYGLDEPGFIQAEIRDNNEVLAYTGRDFLAREWNNKLRKVIKYSFQRNFSEAYDFTLEKGKEETPVVTNGRLLQPRNVHYPIYETYQSIYRESGLAIYEEKSIEDDPWLCSPLFSTFPSKEYDMDPYRYGLSLTYIKKEATPVLNEGHYEIYSLKNEATGFPCLELEALEDSEIYLFFDEIDLNEEKGDRLEINFRRIGCNNVIGMKIKKGHFSFQAFEPYSAKYFRLVVRNGSVKNIKISMVGYTNPDANKLVVECNDEEMNRIIEGARNNFSSNAVDVLTDCPSRERAGWLCDSYFSARAEELFTGKNLVEDNFLDNYLHFKSNIEKGMIPMCYPADNYDEKYIPNWALFYIVEIADHASRLGIDKIVIDSQKNVDDILSFLTKFENEYGLLENLDSWVFVEWSKANDPSFIEGVNFPSNMMYALCLEKAGELYGNEIYKEKGKKLYKIIRELSFNGEFFVDNAIRKDGKLIRTNNMSEACQYYAFFTKIASRPLYPKLYETLLNDFGAKRDDTKIYPNVYKSNAFIGNFLRLMMLLENGNKDCLKNECIAYFKKMAVLTGSLWEMDNPYACSLNHGFASYVANLLLDYLIGYEGRRGNKLFFSSPAINIDCHVEIPLENDTLIFDRKDNKKEIHIPEGYILIEEQHD